MNNKVQPLFCRYKPAEALTSSPLMRKKPAMPLIRGADIVRSTLEADTREVSETDYAVSQSR